MFRSICVSKAFKLIICINNTDIMWCWYCTVALTNMCIGEHWKWLIHTDCSYNWLLLMPCVFAIVTCQCTCNEKGLLQIFCYVAWQHNTHTNTGWSSNSKQNKSRQIYFNWNYNWGLYNTHTALSLTTLTVNSEARWASSQCTVYDPPAMAPSLGTTFHYLLMVFYVLIMFNDN